MIDRKSLLSDLQKQVKAAETDLEAQVKAVPEVGARLRGEYDQAKKLGRTAATWNSWLGERVTQVAVAWVLGTVFVRFSEDNKLIAEPYITAPDVAGREIAQARYEEYLEKDADPTYRGWLETAFAELGAGQAGRLLFDRDHNPLYQIPLSHDGAGALLAFWREQRIVEAGGEGGEGAASPVSALVHDFTDPLSEDGTKGWDTRFLGDLYQDLSEAARKTYALLQTPEFVEEFILDRTMTPAVREFGFEDLKMIDPTCGSGHFVLGAFRRLVRMWAEERPEVGPYERVRASLASVHGVDLNPFAVAIARFRLLVAAMAASGMRTFAEARNFEWPIQLAVGDSLIKDRQLELDLTLGFDDETNAGDPLAGFSYATEDVHEYPGILQQGRYHVVVGNPPYITVKDSVLNKLYRELYNACAGTYALSVPFAQRFFELAMRGGADDHGYGMVGQITANSFMKREFGAKLIEEYFAHKVELTEVIDTSGAYIPGHGTPTVILVGRPREGSKRQATIRTVRSVQGEPSTPRIAENGLVWRAIANQITSPNSTSQWISVDDLDRDRYFANQPWILTAGGLELNRSIEAAATQTLGAYALDIGTGAVPREHEAYEVGDRTLRRKKISDVHIREIVAGNDIRDYAFWEPTPSLWPYSTNTLNADADCESLKFLWPYRTPLSHRVAFGKTQLDRGLTWYEYSMFFRGRYSTPLSIAMAIVSTHNHFALDRGGKIFKQSAPMIKLQGDKTEVEYVQILGILNSSTAAFWLKMVSHSKGTEGHQSGIKTELWEQFYEFTGTNLKEFPLPSERPTNLAIELEGIARQLAAGTSTALSTKSLTTLLLREAEASYTSLRARMVALQEELDWQVYFLYGLHTEDLRLTDISAVPELVLGERAFEIVLARRVAAGEASDEWFKRHGSTPITEIPAHWPADYRALVQKRIDVIESNRAIGMIERPEYKRRWATEGWDSMQQKALRSWLLDRIEDRSYWFDQGGNPTITTLGRLSEALSADEEFSSVAELYAPRQDLAKIVRELLSEEHVPFVSALRYKPAGLKKRADWEHVWDLQREEDKAPDEPAKREIRKRTPVPPKYTSADFLKPSYWRARGKLDVPKERFISYGTVNVQSPDLYGWAGWDHLEQALALASYVQTAGLSSEELVPYLAGLLELQPWLDQWYGEYDPEFGASPAAEILTFRQQKQGELGLTDDALRAWRPAAAPRGRGATKKTAAKKTKTTETED
ncbi:BREX-2 system adenine-specific DNA-methyltransferase PglX [Streptomyces sp. WAC 06725]|uniref:BREX-2 system adenine-specific DNA-methyltransferase PglX n=1 Tax=Streptomyces sp. WAC 06725 TaxID=2203209 RepID=UPI000F73F181|nr:BREX-2 system adenine-specific DNA-methyltransferase PglX [Streptomyces sp. WAC 06725]RSO48375.1 BREX-2 system adenine-specific DNA-methyltransferase PglX [Streptomyces sp. WAC 06725]